MSPSRRRRRASAAWEGRPTISVATLPGRGLYARHLSHPEGVDAVYRPTVGLPGAASRGAAFTPTWLRAHLDTIDVVHVQGLHPQHHPRQIAEATAVVKRTGVPLVVTGYHLSDPSGSDPRLYAAQLDQLVPEADAVVTLTESAADEMRRRWGVEPLVLPHPHVVDFVRMRQARSPRSQRLRVGLHLAALQVPIEPVLLVDALTRACREVPGVQLAVNAHETVLDPGSSTYNAENLHRVERLVRDAGGGLRLHRPFSDAQLWDHLFALDVSVVPGLHGSHSVWPEACADLGTKPLLPGHVHAAGQQPCLTYTVSDDVDELAESLTGALRTALHEPARRADPEQRWAERVRVAETLRALYERLLGIDRR
ncbi:MAG TPA: glycosyltransferase [Kineosporiaceae bacterium]